jgi:predicted ATPase/class 3 adenylate cyclase
MADLPTGTVTFLFTDIEGSTRLWDQHPEAMRDALARHNTLISDGIRQHGGVVVKSRGEGDSVFAVFSRATDALSAASSLQQVLHAEPWPQDASLRIRMALHTGEADLHDGDYYGPAVNRCARLRAAAHGGQVLLSLASAEIVRSALPAAVRLLDLGRHRLQDLAHPEQVFQLVHPSLTAAFPPLRSLDARPQNLPVQPTPLLGREAELERLRELLLRDDVRLVTLTGPGGTGKTRLGLQLAADLLDDFDDGAFFVDLAPIRDPNLVASTIAQSFGVRETSTQTLEQSLTDYLRAKRTLLLLDNFEQIIAAAPRIAELLAAAPRLKVLVTSREALRLRGEQEFPVLPLAVPDLRRLPSLPALSQYAAVELFIQRAVNVKPEFAVTNENAPAVAEICCQLDGLPLAIELAATRIRLFSPEVLLSRLGNRLQLLTGGARDLPARQQTLRDTIAWSYDLLNEGERTLFRRLSVFVGGCTLAAVEAVCGPEGDREMDLLDGITSLLGQSLLRQEEWQGEEHSPPPREAGGSEREVRFTMLETIREFGRERLAQSGEGEALQRRHARFFLTLAEEAEPELSQATQRAWLARLAAEHDNIRAGLAWALESEPETALRLASALGRFWVVQDRVSEGLEALERGLERAAEAPEGVRAKALRARASLPWRVERARALIEEGLPLSRALGDRSSIAFWLNQQAQLAAAQDDPTAARRFLEESMAISREIGDKRCLAHSARMLGSMGCGEYDYETARRWHEESLAIIRETGDRYEIGVAISILGHLAWQTSNYEAARRYYEESLALQREIGSRGRIANSVYGLGDVALAQGDYGAARRYLEESLALLRDLGDRGGLVWALDSLGHLDRDLGEYEAARRLFEEMLAMAREMGAKSVTGFALCRLGTVAWGAGECEAADRLYEESLTLLRETGHPDFFFWPLQGVGCVALAHGEYGRARACYRESLVWLQKRRDMPRVAVGLEGLAQVAAAEGDAEEAARLFGTAGALREAIGSPLAPVDRAEYDRSVAAVRAVLGEVAFAAAWAAGRAMSLEQATALALQQPTPPTER